MGHQRSRLQISSGVQPKNEVHAGEGVGEYKRGEDDWIEYPEAALCEGEGFVRTQTALMNDAA